MMNAILKLMLILYGVVVTLLVLTVVLMIAIFVLKRSKKWEEENTDGL